MTGSWRRLVFAGLGLPHGLVDKAAYSFCVLEQLDRSLRRRDVFARDGDRWGDSRAKLLAGEKWAAAEPKVLTALGLESESAGHLAELATALHAAYVQVAAGLPGNSALEVVGGKLKLARLGKAEEPKLMPPFRQLVNGMLPKVDFPELLLEVAELTGMVDAFTHIFRAENISTANGLFIGAQAKIDVVRACGGGLVASADGVRFTVPVQTFYTGANPRYFGLRHKGATWLNVVNDQVMGLGGVVVPGTLRDSLFILDAIHARDGGPKPETVITDTALYSDIVFGLFAICGYQFSPRIADISDARLWRTNTAADYGPLQPVSNHTMRLDRIRAYWGDMLRVASSLTLGEVRDHDLIRMLSRDGRPTGLGDAFAHYGRIFKTLHLLQFRLGRGLPADDRSPAQLHGGPPPPRPEDLLRAAWRTAPALPRGHGGSARRPRPGPDRACGSCVTRTAMARTTTAGKTEFLRPEGGSACTPPLSSATSRRVPAGTGSRSVRVDQDAHPACVAL
ncbi:Tn3 family transposase [Streptomyces malaysiensis]|uniref:Tn3 family transposase n=1 Tax=Streptomyces malaysiensis TaxID=92644 RepID=UPI003D9F67FB